LVEEVVGETHKRLVDERQEMHTGIVRPKRKYICAGKRTEYGDRTRVGVANGASHKQESGAGDDRKLLGRPDTGKQIREEKEREREGTVPFHAGRPRKILER